MLEYPWPLSSAPYSTIEEVDCKSTIVMMPQGEVEWEDLAPRDATCWECWAFRELAQRRPSSRSPQLHSSASSCICGIALSAFAFYIA